MDYALPTTRIRNVKGRTSKYSSEIRVFNIKDLKQENDELTAFFGPVDAVARRQEYRRLANK